MSEARVNNLSNESNTGGPTITGITTFSGTNYFVPPVGSTLQRPENPQKGELRFNTDTKHLEYYRGDICLLYTSPSPRDRTRSRMPSSA